MKLVVWINDARAEMEIPIDVFIKAGDGGQVEVKLTVVNPPAPSPYEGHSHED